MKPQELMIGDWVIRKGDPDEPMRLYDMDASRGIAYVEMCSGDNTEWLENLEPLLLTQKIIEKNGFKKVNGYVTEEAYILDECIGGEPNIIIRRFDFNESFVLCTPKDQKARVSIAYVHKLQHALKLCGIEKEIIL